MLMPWSTFKNYTVTACCSKKQQSVYLSGPVDIIVATPTRFLQHVKEGNVFFKVKFSALWWQQVFL